MAAAVAGTWALTACFDAVVTGDPPVSCRFDPDCPAGLRCVEGLLLCGAPGECIEGGPAALRARADGSACGGVAATNICVAGDCLVGRCGDGVIDPRSEACDDGDANRDDAPNQCRTTCELPRCGDDVVDDFESCDGSPDGADGCALCVAGCAIGRGDCVDDADRCDCDIEVFVDEPFTLNTLLTLTVDASGAYWVGADQSIRRTPLTGGPPEIVIPPNGNEVVTQLLVADGTLLRVAIDVGVPSSRLTAFELATEEGGGGAIATTTVDASAVAIDADWIWLVAFGVGRLSRATLEGDFVYIGDVAVSAISAADDFIAFADDVGIVRTVPRVGPPDVTIIARDQFALSALRAADDTVVWNDGDDVRLWRAGFAAPTTLARVSDGQRGLRHIDLVLHADTVYLGIEDRSDQRPGGIMRLDPGASAWRQVARTRGGPMVPHDGSLFVLSFDGVLRVPLALRPP
jgi:hypothetical protein